MICPECGYESKSDEDNHLRREMAFCVYDRRSQHDPRDPSVKLAFVERVQRWRHSGCPKPNCGAMGSVFYTRAPESEDKSN